MAKLFINHFLLIFLCTTSIAGLDKPPPEKNPKINHLGRSYIGIAENVFVLETIFDGYITIREFQTMAAEYIRLALHSRTPNGFYFYDNREELRDLTYNFLELMSATDRDSADDLRSLVHLFFRLNTLLQNPSVSIALAREIFIQARSALPLSGFINYAQMLIQNANTLLTPSSVLTSRSEQQRLEGSSIPVTPYTVLFFRTLLAAGFEEETAANLTRLAWLNHRGDLPVHQGVLIAAMIRILDTPSTGTDHQTIAISVAWIQMVRGGLTPEQIRGQILQATRPQRTSRPSIARAKAMR